MCGLGARGGDARGAVGREGERERGKAGLGAVLWRRECCSSLVSSRLGRFSLLTLYCASVGEKKVECKKKNPEESGEGEEEEGFGVGSGNAKWICEPPPPIVFAKRHAQSNAPSI